MKYDVITIGEILVEIVAKDRGQSFAESGGVLFGPFPSGAPAIAIDQAARMGAKTSIIAKIGMDDFGKVNKQRLKGSGVDVSNIIETNENTTGCAFVTYDSSGERKFIFHLSKAACGELAPEDIDEEVISNAGILHIMGCSITGSKMMAKAIMKGIRIAKEKGTKISFDPNIRPELLKGEVMTYYKEILECCDYLLAGKSEMSILFKDHKQKIKEMLLEKERVIVVKDGSRGVEVYTREETFCLRSYPANEVDPTGAGDSFDGTFLAMIGKTDLKTSVMYANAAGACAVSKIGPMEGNSYPEKVREVIEQNRDIVCEETMIGL